MFENVIKFTAKVDERLSYWYIENGTPIEIAEKMCVQFLQQLAAIKIQQEEAIAAEKEAQEPPVEQPVQQPLEV